ncbi:porin [Cupriavidus necator]|uniref:Porin n=2 Tax=Cupriavidus necator TaxID=106590 RepID=A0A1U9UZP1_CUPNE|nr:porin [Cupriavidus necator]
MAQTGAGAPGGSVNIYGVLDAGYVYQSGSVNNANGTASGPVVKNAIQGGVARGSRLGLRGSENLGNGLKAIFAAEMGFYVDTGVSSQGAQVLNQYPAGPMFGRQAFVGLASNAGTLTMGRQYTPAFLVTTLADPFFQGTAGNMANLQNTSGRASNSVIYMTPAYGGLTASAMYAFGEVPGDTAKGRQYSANLVYQASPLSVGLAFYNANNPGATATSRTTTLAANYDAGFATLYGDLQIQRASVENAPGSAVLGGDRVFTSYNSFLVGLSVPLGRHQFLLSYIYNRDMRGGPASNRDASQFAVGYKYHFSKRTYLYSAYGTVTNHNGASYTIGDALSVNGNARRAFNLGLSHDF